MKKINCPSKEYRRERSLQNVLRCICDDIFVKGSTNIITGIYRVF